MVKLRTLNLQFPQLYRWLSSLPSGLQSVLLVAIYVIAGLLLDEVAAVFETADEVTAWYPPAALHIVLLLRFGLRYIPELLFVPLLDGLVFSPLDIAPLYVLIEALCIMLCYGTACALLLQKLHIDPRLPHFRDVLWFTIVALVASLAVATATVTTFAEAGNISWSQWGVRVLHMWAGNATGIALLAPPLLLVLRAFPKDGAIVSAASSLPQINIFSWQRRKLLEWIAEIVALVVVGWVAYGLPSITNLDYTYFIFLPIIWISMRHGFQRTVLAVLLLNISVATYVGTKLSDTNQLALQFGLITVSYTGLLVGAVITEQNRGKQQLLYDASHDRLTEVYNRSGFMDKLDQAFARASVDENYLFAVIFLDLDRFKVVNDSLGHLIGDQLLSAIAPKLKLCLQPKDTIARFGGDEFTILLEDIQAISDATRVAEQINEQLKQSFNLDGYYAFTTASIGIALYSLDYQQPADLIRDANIAMYRAKAGGRGRYAVFDKAMHEDIIMLSQLENDLRRDIQKIEQPLNKFQLYYQPLVSLFTGRIIGFEALIRWHHPIRGLVCPAHFIPLAEETGMIIPIGNWVLREACRQMQMWQQAFSDKAPSIIAVNLSAKQFLQLDLVEQIDSILQETGLKPGSLTLEITETIVMENSEEAALMLLRLKALGVGLSIDDFGTGYSSLSRLHSFPVNTLKIDRSFVNQIGSDGENSEIVQAIVMLAEQIGVGVTAEGVETTAQLTKLKELNCHEAQGYFFARPLSAQAAQELIAASPQW